jgi:hypothetical protein
MKQKEHGYTGEVGVNNGHPVAKASLSLKTTGQNATEVQDGAVDYSFFRDGRAWAELLLQDMPEWLIHVQPSGFNPDTDSKHISHRITFSPFAPVLLSQASTKENRDSDLTGWNKNLNATYKYGVTLNKSTDHYRQWERSQPEVGSRHVTDCSDNIYAQRSLGLSFINSKQVHTWVDVTDSDGNSRKRGLIVLVSVSSIAFLCSFNSKT